MARPPKKIDDHRSAVVSFRLTAAEGAALDARAATAGMKPADFARRATLRGRVAVQQATKADPELIRQLVKIGTNLNQLTRTANGVGQAPPDLDRLCQKIEAFVDRAIGAEPA